MSPITIIFGGTGGIGSAIARNLVQRGERILLVARNEQTLSLLANELGCGFATCDVTDEEAVQRLVAKVSENSKVKGAAICVGSILLKPLHATSVQDFHATWSANVLPAFMTMKYLIPVMREEGGSILLFSSAAAEIGLPNHEAIGSAKAAVVGLAKSAAATYAADGIRVNCIAPGLVRTPLSQKITSNPLAEKASLAFHPLNRLGETRDIAGLASWLLSDEGSWATGQVFTVDGGLSGLKVTRPSS